MAEVNRQAKLAEQGRCRQTQPADDPTGTGLAAKQQPPMLAGLWPCSAGWWREYGGAGTQEAAQTDITVSLPPIAFACLCTYPLP